MRLMLVMVAGGLGCGTRYLIGLWAVERLGAGFPYGTVIVNLTGCFVIGFAMSAASAADWDHHVRAAVISGFVGGFTTYSSFNQETLSLFAHGSAGTAAVNLLVTLIGGLAAGWLGLLAARQFVA
jgi:CrcB protein